MGCLAVVFVSVIIISPLGDIVNTFLSLLGDIF
nr:MAG TPA: hypothetical protein [Caudoviricetes sp.]